MSKFYAVRKGRIPGIYKSWNECNIQVTGFKGAEFKGFNTESEAQQFIMGISQIIVSNPSQHKIISFDLPIQELPLFDPNRVIYVDGGCNNFTKPFALGSCVDHYKNDIIENYRFLLPDMDLVICDLPVGRRTLIKCKFDDVETQQNNAAELLSAVAGLRIALHLIRNNYQIQYVFSDSKLIVEYWSNGMIRKETAMKMDPVKLRYVNELVALKKLFTEMGGSLYRISGDSNPADLGYHK